MLYTTATTSLYTISCSALLCSVLFCSGLVGSWLMAGHHQRQVQLGGGGADTTFTKIFVGGLAWETQRDTMRRYFEQFGEILEAVVITDKHSGRSKGYGFVCSLLLRRHATIQSFCVSLAFLSMFMLFFFPLIFALHCIALH